MADLIGRAMDRLQQQSKSSLVERVAAEIAKKEVADRQAELPSAPHPSDVHRAANNGAPVRPHSPASPEPIVAPAPESLPLPRTRRTLTIDWGRLQLMGMITPNSEATRITEEFRIVKRPLINRAYGEPNERVERGNLIMITSARPNEGKTFVAINLALSLASEKGLNVLLIDADFHNSSIPDRLGFTADVGMIDALNDRKMDLSEVLIRTDLPNFSVLPAGRASSETTEILASQRMESFVDEVSRRYPDRMVIFDAPPVLASSEPTVLASHVGQVVFVIEAESTSATVVQDALGLISNCPNISLLLNKRDTSTSSEGFGSYYGYGISAS